MIIYSFIYVFMYVCIYFFPSLLIYLFIYLLAMSSGTTWPSSLFMTFQCSFITIASMTIHKVKVKCTLVQALRFCTGRTARRGSRGVALLFLDHDTRRWWVVSATPRPLFTHGKDPVPIVQEAGAGLDRCWKSRPLPGLDRQTVQPVASRYIDYATRPTSMTIQST